MNSLVIDTNGTASTGQARTRRMNARARGESAVEQLRSLMRALATAAVALGVLTGLLSWRAVAVTYDEYHTIVDEAAVSVDAALAARARALDHMSAAAGYLATSGPSQELALQSARYNWTAFNEQARISWRNISDLLQGEDKVFSAMDSAAADYILSIGAMYSYARAGQAAAAGSAFLAARETMNTRLIPALSGLEQVKVERMEATYVGAEKRIGGWRNAVLFACALVIAVLLGMLWAVRRMHYRWSWPVGIALGATLLAGTGLQMHLAAAAGDTSLLVREAYDNVAGVQDLAALLSQERALDSIMVFDPANTDRYRADFDQYHTLVEQRLCGPRDCTSVSFVSAEDTISSAAMAIAAREKDKLSLPHMPLVANVYLIKGLPGQLEELRQAYREWLDVHNRLVAQVQAGQHDDAVATSSEQSRQAFTRLVETSAAATGLARDKFNSIWRNVYAGTGSGNMLALLLASSGTLAAWGILRRRSELT